MLIFNYSSFKFVQKNTRKYVFDVKFSAEHDVRKNYKNRGKPENRKKVKNLEIAVAKKPPAFKISTTRQKIRFSLYFKKEKWNFAYINTRIIYGDIFEQFLRITLKKASFPGKF